MRVRVLLPSDVATRKLRLLVSGQTIPVSVQAGWASFEVPSVLDHEVVLIE
jgi:hypothetical protein